MKIILVVEDEFVIADMLRAFLEEEGYRVMVAHNGQEGLACLAEIGIHLVLTDVMMPILDGHQLLRLMRADARFAHIPVILMSAANLELSFNGTLVPFLRKPFDLDQLLESVEQNLVAGVPNV